MGKLPTQGQKKTKESIAKAASQSKKGKKKWSKGKAGDKVNHDVFFTQQTLKDALNTIHRIGKHISVSGVVEKFKISGSLARALLRRATAQGLIRNVESHSKQAILTPILQAKEATEAVEGQPKEEKKKEKKSKAK